MWARCLMLLVPLLALFALVATTQDKRAGAEDVAQFVEGENLDVQPTGTSVVTDTMYHNGKALEFSDTVIATETVTFNSQGDVVLWARATQSGGSPKLKVGVNGDFTVAPAQPITNSGAPAPYTFDVNAPSGNVKIGVKAVNTGTGRHPFLDYVTSPLSGGGGTTPPPSSWDCTGTQIN
jgi:hypothetical protein